MARPQRIESSRPARRPVLEDSMVTDKVVVISLRISPELKVAVDRAVERSGLGLSDWIRAVLARAANEGAFAPPAGRKRHGRREN